MTCIVLHTSWRGRALAVGVPVLLLGLFGWAALTGRSSPVSIGLGLLGLVLLGVAVFDYPLRCRINGRGLVRECPLRHHQLAWSEVDSVARPSRNLRSRALKLPNPRGLVAERGRRRYLLVDRAESPHEYDVVVERVSQLAPEVLVRASRPAEGTAPTWLYKRRPGEGLVDERPDGG